MNFPIFIKSFFNEELIIAVRHKKDIGVYLHKDGRVEFARKEAPPYLQIVNEDKGSFELFNNRDEAEMFLGTPIKDLEVEDLRIYPTGRGGTPLIDFVATPPFAD